MKKTLFLFTLIVASHITPTHAVDNDTKWVIGIAAGSVAVVGFGAYLLYRAFRATDEQMIAKGQETITQARQQFDYALSLLKKSRIDSAHTVSESTLSDLERLLSKLNSVQNTTKQLQDHAAFLDKRIMALRSKADIKSSIVCQTMEKQQKELSSFLSDLVLLSQIFELHKGYFTVTTLCEQLSKLYAEELEVLEKYGHDQYLIEKLLRECVLVKGRQAGYRYAFVSYASSIQSNIHALQKAINDTPVTNKAKIAQGEALLKKLQRISRIIHMDQQFSTETQLMDQERRERERLAVERKRLETEQRKVNELEKQVKLLNSLVHPPATTTIVLPIAAPAAPGTSSATTPLSTHRAPGS